jgi:hypothetical protein
MTQAAAGTGKGRPVRVLVADVLRVRKVLRAGFTVELTGVERGFTLLARPVADKPGWAHLWLSRTSDGNCWSATIPVGAEFRLASWVQYFITDCVENWDLPAGYIPPPAR